MALDDLPRDVQTESQSAVVGRRHLPAAMKALEDLRELVGRDADAAIGNRGDDLIAALFDVDENLAAFR